MSRRITAKVGELQVGDTIVTSMVSTHWEVVGRERLTHVNETSGRHLLLVLRNPSGQTYHYFGQLSDSVHLIIA